MEMYGDQNGPSSLVRALDNGGGVWYDGIQIITEAAAESGKTSSGRRGTYGEDGR